MKQNKNKRNQKIIGITGGIGAGKSTAIDYLQKKGFPIIDADDISRLIVFPDSEASKQIEYAFGREYFQDDGWLNRPKLASLIFHDSNQRQKLNDIMFPLIWKEIHRQIAEIFQDSNIHTVFVEAAVLIESGGLGYVDEVWVVASDEAVRLERITKRDHLDAQSAQARINSQIPQEQNIVHANVVLNNSHDEQTLYKQIDLLI